MGKKKNIQFYDNIYGYIDFDKEFFEKILNDPFFLRLHNIKQMGLTNFVFPDALHTRFAHSLGVYKIISKMIDIQNSFEIDELDPIEQQKIKLSALLHDIGHLPLSHTIESALEDFEKEEKEENANQEQKIKSAENKFVEGKSSVNGENNVGKLENLNVKIGENSPKLHEKLGEYVLGASKISSYLESKNIFYRDISAGFKGDIDNIDKLDISKDNLYTTQIRNFLHSQLDADRIDYLLRDSSFSGVKTGGFDVDKLLNSIRFDKHKNYGIEESAIRAVEQFLFSRVTSYCQIVGNKKVMAYDYMAKDFYLRLLRLIKKGNLDFPMGVYSYRDLTDDILQKESNKFLEFTDNYFFSLIREVYINQTKYNKLDPFLYKYAKGIIEVQPLVQVSGVECFCDCKNEECFYMELYKKQPLRDKIAEAAKIDASEIIVPKPLSLSVYENSNIDKIQIINENQIKYQDISQCKASIFRYLLPYKVRICRVFTFSENKAELIRRVLPEIKKEYTCKGDVITN